MTSLLTKMKNANLLSAKKNDDLWTWGTQPYHSNNVVNLNSSSTFDPPDC